MAGGIQGADLAQLQHLVQQLGGPFQSELQATLNGMNQKVQASSCVLGGAERRPVPQ